MGGGFSLSYLQQIITAECERILGDKERDYLKISEVLQLKPPEEIPFTSYHIGTLYWMDEDKDGRFSVQELEEFANFWLDKQKMFKQQNLYKPYEMHSMLQASCTYVMWNSVSQEEGEDDFVAWIGRILLENENVASFDQKPGVPFIRSDTIVHLFDILNVKATHGIEFQVFFDLLQQAAEEIGLMNLECEEMDDYVPLTICQQFTRDFVKGFARLMNQIGLAAPVKF